MPKFWVQIFHGVINGQGFCQTEGLKQNQENFEF